VYKLTVVICVFNEDMCLLNALRSLYHNKIYTQTEVIIVDDCSTNLTTLRLLQLIEKFSRHKIIRSQQNLGLSNSRNLGFKNALTPYILPLDADDVFPRGTLDGIYTAFTTNPGFDFIVGNYYLKDVQSGETKIVDCSSIATSNVVDIKKLSVDWKLLGTSPCKKIAWEKVGGYNLKYSYSVQDVDFWINVLQSGSKGLYLDNLIYIWNRSATGMNVNFDRLDMIKLLEDHQEFYLLTWQNSYLCNKIFEGYYPYKQKKALLPFAKKNFQYLNIKNKLRFLSGFFLWR